MLKGGLLCLLGLALAGCSGMSQNKEQFTTHAESFNVLFLQIPGNTMERAHDLVPEDGEIKTITQTPRDTTSLVGVVNRLFGFEHVRLGGEVAEINP